MVEKHFVTALCNCICKKQKDLGNHCSKKNYLRNTLIEKNQIALQQKYFEHRWGENSWNHSLANKILKKLVGKNFVKTLLCTTEGFWTEKCKKFREINLQPKNYKID